MTTNVVVATYHGVVLGCDSLASVVERAFFPFRGGQAFARDASGSLMRDAEGNPLLVYSENNLIATPTNFMGGVRKLFLLHESPNPDDVVCSVAATTAGLGTLNGVVIAEIADRFKRHARSSGRDFASAGEVVEEFCRFVRPLWETQVDWHHTPDDQKAFLSDLEFLVAGYGPEDEYIKVYRISIAKPDAMEIFTEPPHCSAAWAGQADSISSLVNGFSTATKWAVERSVADALADQRQTIVSSVLDQLRAQGVQVPEPFEATIDVAVPAELPWGQAAPAVDWANLPVQSAVDLVSTLVNAESAIQKFSMGIATVGGRTRIGLMRRGMPFAFLNEPEIVHHHVGYNHDA
ncbi:hypothetical protein QF205_03940 [Luteimonas composti]|uniref:Uncharacterized protein n=1 Tax=Luteimonas composti TaxID=398257 RepID=A0ABT6MNU8_9GAMM|nr:hypothetical protein [Luteimonas composti]MDH7452234.1 hypothetical protein [Luteimonas composti]